MELKEFINGTLQSVIEALLDNQDKYAGRKVKIMPPVVYQNHGNADTTNDDTENARIDFDVAVTASSAQSESAAGGAGIAASIKVLSAGIKGQVTANDVQENSNVSRVTFSIPLHIPPKY